MRDVMKGNSKITIYPGGDVLEEVDESQSLLSILKKNKYYIKSSCGGHGKCSDCVVKILNGLENLSDQTFLEKSILGNVVHITKERLSCQTKVLGECRVDISSHDQSLLMLEEPVEDSQTVKTILKKGSSIETKEERKPSLDTKEKPWFEHWKKRK